jgi:hypothetical protein
MKMVKILWFHVLWFFDEERARLERADYTFGISPEYRATHPDKLKEYRRQHVLHHCGLAPEPDRYDYIDRPYGV